MNDLSNRLKFPNKTVGPTRVRYLVVDIDTINAYPRYDILSHEKPDWGSCEAATRASVLCIIGGLNTPNMSVANILEALQTVAIHLRPVAICCNVFTTCCNVFVACSNLSPILPTYVHTSSPGFSPSGIATVHIIMWAA